VQDKTLKVWPLALLTNIGQTVYSWAAIASSLIDTPFHVILVGHAVCRSPR
jgi:hypothetical protein